MIEGKSVTAIIFAYNEEKYIRHTLDSIVIQKEVDKIIFIDDQSTDNTVEIVNEYNFQIEIKSYRNQFKGKANAFALGLSKVKTDLFFVCHGDDILLPKYVEKLFSFLKEKKIKFCYANSILCDENMLQINNTLVSDVYSDLDILDRNAVGGYIFGYSTIIQEILPFPENLTFEDWFTNVKLVCLFKNLHVYVPPTFLYRRHSSSDSIRLNKTLPVRSYNLLKRILDEGLIDLNTEQKSVLIETRERYHSISLSMNYLFLNNNDYPPKIKLLKSKHASNYLKSLIILKTILFLSKEVMLKIDSFIIKTIK